jgi:hypothetical protein
MHELGRNDRPFSSTAVFLMLVMRIAKKLRPAPAGKLTQAVSRREVVSGKRR